MIRVDYRLLNNAIASSHVFRSSGACSRLSNLIDDADDGLLLEGLVLQPDSSYRGY